jgi:hypothetical protein
MLQPMNLVLVLSPVFAVLVFWGVGMRSRVLRQRQRALDSFVEMERQVLGYAGLISAPETAPTQLAPWEVLQQQTQLLEAACKSVRQSMLSVPTVEALRLQLQALDQQWQAVQQAPADLAGSPVPESLQLQWEEVQRKAQMASAAYNHLAGQYNEALHQRPARWAVRLMGLRSAGLV